MCGAFPSNTPVKDPLVKMTLFDESTDPVGGAPATAGTASTEIASAKTPSSIVMVLFIVLESSPFLQPRHMFETRFRRFSSKWSEITASTLVEPVLRVQTGMFWDPRTIRAIKIGRASCRERMKK